MGFALPTFALIGLVLAMYAAAKFLRDRMGVGKGTVAPDAMKIVGKRALEQHKSLYVVEVGSRYIIVGASENSLSLIDRLSAEEFEAMTTTNDDAPVSPIRRMPQDRTTAKTSGTGSMILAPGKGLARMMGIRTPADVEAAKSAGAATGSGRNGFMTTRESFAYFMGKARTKGAEAVTSADGAVELDSGAPNGDDSVEAAG